MSDLLNGLVHLTSMLLIPGLAYGSQLALGALGVTLLFGVLRFSSFAHDGGLSLGTALTILITLWLQGMGVSLGLLPTALLGMLLAMPLLALIFIGTDRALYHHFRRINARPEVFMNVAAGVMPMMNGVIRLVIGPDGRDFEDGERFIVTAMGFREWSGLSEPLVLKTSRWRFPNRRNLCVEKGAGIPHARRVEADRIDAAFVHRIQIRRVVLLVRPAGIYEKATR
jgi:branched-chain amino acid transport system permease protein